MIRDSERGRPLDTGARRRYARQLTLEQVGESGQTRLRDARVLVIGAGGLGSLAALYLAAAGIGTIGIVDDDVVEESNLQRQVIHDTASVGAAKVASAAARIAALNPLVRVEQHPFRFTAHNAVEVVAGYDVVVDGADNFATRYAVADACAVTARAHVWGSILRFDGQVSVWDPPRGPCYRCVFPKPPPAGSVASCAQAGVLGSLCAAIGAVQCTEALKLVLGVGEPLIGRLVIHDALAGTWGEVPVRRRDGCELCGPAATITAPRDESEAVPGGRGICGSDLVTALAGGEEVVLVDVREPGEWAGGVIAGARLLSLGHLDRLDAPHTARVVLYCAAGGRSAAGVELLSAAGYRDVTDLAGGIGGWPGDLIAPGTAEDRA